MNLPKSKLFHSLILLFTAIPMIMSAQTDLKYQIPPKDLVAVVDAPATPGMQADPSGRFALFLTRSENPTIEDFADEMLRLAGLRIDPSINAASRPSYSVDIELMVLTTLEKKHFTGMPEPVKIMQVSWAPDSRGFSFFQLTPKGLCLWYADAVTLIARKLSDQPVNSLMGQAISWLPNSSGLICKMIPAERGPRPAISQVPAGPVIQETSGNKAAVRTNQDMLTGPQDEILFDYFGQSEVILINLDGTSRTILPNDMYTRIDMSPGGEYFLTERISKPYSYLVGYSDFPSIVEVVDLNGKIVRELFRIPLMENVPTGYDATAPGPRNINWRADIPATVYWAEALDGGDPKKDVPYRDQVYRIDAPFTGSPVAQLKTKLRFKGITWARAELSVIRQASSKTKQEIISFFDHANPAAEPRVIWDRSSEDKYGDPGDFVMTSNRGRSTILIADKGNTMFLTGSGASPEGDRPFLDKFDIKTFQVKRLWQSNTPYFESVSKILDPDKLVILTSRQSVTEPSNFFIRNLKSKKGTQPVQVTQFTNPYPFMEGVKKERITYNRADGVQLTATLYTPAGWKKEDGPLPTLLWAYPVEFKSKSAAGQVSGSPYTFTRLSASSAVPFVTQGYAILDNAAFPIIGEGDAEPNDTFIEQLVANAKAAIDKGAEMGVVDPKRVAAGGHSYGAFMTANLLAHCDLFAAGIARSGAYMRSLTPFGFQSEPRTYWEATDLYNKMSPFNYADKIKTPLLMIHGIADNNQGTFPIQSERMYAALKGLGATARLVLLPLESHGYAARESLLHMLWEMNTWMDKYVKNIK
ncbi:MAG: prolyl oligopeptidase family serine peptidase [Bacteroidia bacterium]|nr:prolyl oligopeptidase family serine peptidase [Bacteroidia bacterium]